MPSTERRATVTPEKAQVYKVIADIILKGLLGVVCAIALLWVLWALIEDPNWPLAAVEIVFGGTVFRAYGHFFYKRAQKAEFTCSECGNTETMLIEP